MGYDRGDSFSFDFESNGIPFVSKSKGELSPRSYHIQFERNWNASFLSAIIMPQMSVVIAFLVIIIIYALPALMIFIRSFNVRSLHSNIGKLLLILDKHS